MAYTCPDCLRTSHHPQDEKNLYCGNCHEFKPGNVHYELSEFQLAIARALQGPSPQPYVLAAVAQHFLDAQATWDTILLELLPLYNARRLSKVAVDVLVAVTTRVGHMTNVTHPSE